MRVSSFNVMRLSLLASLLLAIESSSVASSDPVKLEVAGELPGAPSPLQDQEVVKQAQSLDETIDLKRLKGVPAADSLPADQQQLEPVAEANHQTRASYLNVPLDMADLLVASNSMPAGRRRLDSGSDVHFVAGDQALLDVAQSDPLALSRETLVTAAALNRQADRHWPNMNQYGKIVDNGDGSQFKERQPSAQLLAKLADDNNRRMALASSLRQQQALANKMARRQLGAASPARRAHRRAGANQMARQQSQPWRAKSSGRSKDGGSEETDDEYDELDGRRESSNRDEESSESEDGADADEEGGDERSAAPSRRSSDPFFDDAEPEERRHSSNNDKSTASNDNEDAEGDETNSAPGAQRRQMLRRQGGQQARSQPEGRPRRPDSPPRGGRSVTARRQMNAGRRKTGGRRQRPRAGGEQSEDIDSMNSHRQSVRASLRAGANNGRSDGDSRRSLAFDDANSINGRRQRAGSPNTAGQFSGTAGDNLQAAGDSDLSASHIRNSAADLQAAAGHHHGHGHYYQHVEVPKKKAWKFGFKRGNHKHTIEKHEKGYKHKFHTKFKWHAKEKCKKKSKCESVGKMTWDYKHHKKHHH